MKKFRSLERTDWQAVDFWPMDAESRQLQVATFSVEVGGKIRHHKHKTEDIVWVVTQGRGHVRVDDEVVEVSAGDVVLIEAPSVHGANADLGEQLQVVQIECVLPARLPPEPEGALLKLIRCRVPAENRARFSAVQSGWGSLAEIVGCIGQAGGWSFGSETEACVLGVWTDELAYSAFMAGPHDALAAKHQGGATYSELHTELADRVCEQPGTAGSFADAFRVCSAGVMVIELVEVRGAFDARFMATERDLWLPAMCMTGQLSAAATGRFRAGRNRFMRVSLWEGMEPYEAFARNTGALRERCDTSRVVKSQQAVCVPLVEPWHVAGPGRRGG